MKGNLPVSQVLWFHCKQTSHWIPCCRDITGLLHVMQLSAILEIENWNRKHLAIGWDPSHSLQDFQLRYNLTFSKKMWPSSGKRTLMLFRYSATGKTVNTWNISGMFIVLCPITAKIRTCQLDTKAQTNWRSRLRFSFLAPDWLFSCNTITFQKSFWCSRFSRFYGKWVQTNGWWTTC